MLTPCEHPAGNRIGLEGEERNWGEASRREVGGGQINFRGRNNVHDTRCPLLSSLSSIYELQSLDPLWAGNTPVGLPPSRGWAPGYLLAC